MTLSARIETQEAKALRSARQHFAAPGGRHDKVIAFLAKALPMGIGVIAALMIVTPLSPRGEVSFLLDRNKVQVINERLSVDNAMYRGADAQGRPFSLTAGEAVQRSGREGIVRMQDLVARILLDGGPASVRADAGQYDIREEVVSVPGGVVVTAADGYRMVARGVTVDIPEKRMVGSGGVSGAVPAGTFSANRLEADLEARTVSLAGNARLRMIPGKLRMPR
ncbi:LPS export ABC transporter periplasmic protein LptC [Tsuneonella sp. YG55]|uniref:LPS export ABC transporter periplasmic protein LptC n=1 Tax=Tsuneonella litorea TaxID=2976475 RepID=A0A9X2W033_9SPHN|nr:LPS export ABC transporter periplasmic protein LptC [Tsuneonella litorea]MCT2557724.1 LPS export ABC transporter periplasmic protein LptC [Tsuneonella litorea]